MHRWARQNTFTHADFATVEDLVRGRAASVAVCIPARDEERTIGAIAAAAVSLRDRGLVARVVVVADRCTDATAQVSLRAGAEVLGSGLLMPEEGPVAGKGDVMWRALSVLREDIVCYVDGDSRDFGAHFVAGLVGPLLVRSDLAFVKGDFRRPLIHAGCEVPDEGGRVSQLMARPLLRRLYPELAGLGQPLAGEIAARGALLDRLPFEGGYGVEVGMLIDVLGQAGTGAMAQVDLGTRRNAHKPLASLGPMADEVLATVLDRARRDGRLALESGGPPDAERVVRPPMDALRAPV
ncbi:MAG TPA: glucosyl-3-phosphoglycerate synthase [Solirubrobacteraceae bacterium]|nr:glucosyl-3-phosphoglycerate synthase [Solirubrobacteraceae bacterium]